MCVVFDMDGLMLDTERVYIPSWDYAGEKMGIGKAGYMIYKTLGMNAEASRRIWEEDFGKGFPLDELHQHTSAFKQRYYAENKVPVKKGLYLLLEYLKGRGCKMAVASSTASGEVERLLTEAGVYRYFDGAVCGDMVRNSKPDPEIYEKACKLLGSPPERCFAVEDSRNGILAACRAGCKTVMVPDLWQPDAETLDMVVGVYSDLEKVKDAFENGELKL